MNGMNAALSAIAAQESDRRFMPPVPSAFHDHGGGLCEEVPLVTRGYLLTCGTVALYLVLDQLDASERLDASTKEELAELILSKTRDGTPARSPFFGTECQALSAKCQVPSDKTKN